MAGGRQASTCQPCKGSWRGGLLWATPRAFAAPASVRSACGRPDSHVAAATRTARPSCWLEELEDIRVKLPPSGPCPLECRPWGASQTQSAFGEAECPLRPEPLPVTSSWETWRPLCTHRQGAPSSQGQSQDLCGAGWSRGGEQHFLSWPTFMNLPATSWLGTWVVRPGPCPQGTHLRSQGGRGDPVRGHPVPLMLLTAHRGSGPNLLPPPPHSHTEHWPLRPSDQQAGRQGPESCRRPGGVWAGRWAGTCISPATPRAGRGRPSTSLPCVLAPPV